MSQEMRRFPVHRDLGRVSRNYAHTALRIAPERRLKPLFLRMSQLLLLFATANLEKYVLFHTFSRGRIVFCVGF